METFTTHYYLKKHKKNVHEVEESLDDVYNLFQVETYIDYEKFNKSGMLINAVKTKAIETMKKTEPETPLFAFLHVNDPNQEPLIVKIRPFNHDYDLIKPATQVDLDLARYSTKENDTTQLNIVARIKEYYDETDNLVKYHILPPNYDITKWGQDLCRARAKQIAKKREEIMEKIRKEQEMFANVVGGPVQRRNVEVVALNQPIPVKNQGRTTTERLDVSQKA